MKKLLLTTILLILFSCFLWADDLVIKSKQVVEEDVRVASGNVNIESGANLMGNIFIEEGDLFIGVEVNIAGGITIKKGNIFIKDSAKIMKDIRCEHGKISMGSKNEIHGAISAMELIQEGKNIIKGGFKQLKK